MPDTVTVCLLVEGSYPFITGGVSAWVQELIAALPDVRFTLFTVSPKTGQPLRYVLPANVIAHRDIVVNEKRPSHGKPRDGAADFIHRVHGMHAAFESGSDPRPEGDHRPDAPRLHPVRRCRARARGVGHDRRGERRVTTRSTRSRSTSGPGSPRTTWCSTSWAKSCRRRTCTTPVCTGYVGLAAVTAKLRTGTAISPHRARAVPQGTGDGDQAGHRS